MSQLCLSLEALQDLRHAGNRYIQDVLSARAEHPSALWRSSVAVTRAATSSGGTLRILAASEELADVEEHLKARWLLNPESHDLRYILRAALHDASIQEKLDLVLIDCPPRLSTACINAFAACDSVLIPVLPDRVSAEAVPRLLKWLFHLRGQQICPDLSVLGLVINRTQQSAKLTVKETAIREGLAAKSQQAWKDSVYLFDRFVPSSQGIADAAERGEFAAYRPNLESLFLDLATKCNGG